MTICRNLVLLYIQLLNTNINSRCWYCYNQSVYNRLSDFHLSYIIQIVYIEKSTKQTINLYPNYTVLISCILL